MSKTYLNWLISWHLEFAFSPLLIWNWWMLSLCIFFLDMTQRYSFAEEMLWFLSLKLWLKLENFCLNQIIHIYLYFPPSKIYPMSDIFALVITKLTYQSKLLNCPLFWNLSIPWNVNWVDDLDTFFYILELNLHCIAIEKSPVQCKDQREKFDPISHLPWSVCCQESADNFFLLQHWYTGCFFSH